MNSKSIYEPFHGGKDALPAVAYLVRPPQRPDDGQYETDNLWPVLEVQRTLIAATAMLDHAVIVAEHIEDAENVWFEHRLPASADHHDWELRLGARRRYYLDYVGRGRPDRVRSQSTDVPEPESDQPEE